MSEQLSNTSCDIDQARHSRPVNLGIPPSKSKVAAKELNHLPRPSPSNSHHSFSKQLLSSPIRFIDESPITKEYYTRVTMQGRLNNVGNTNTTTNEGGGMDSDNDEMSSDYCRGGGRMTTVTDDEEDEDINDPDDVEGGYFEDDETMGGAEVAAYEGGNNNVQGSDKYIQDLFCRPNYATHIWPAKLDYNDQHEDHNVDEQDYARQREALERGGSRCSSKQGTFRSQDGGVIRFVNPNDVVDAKCLDETSDEWDDRNIILPSQIALETLKPFASTVYDNKVSSYKIFTSTPNPNDDELFYTQQQQQDHQDQMLGQRHLNKVLPQNRSHLSNHDRPFDPRESYHKAMKNNFFGDENKSTNVGIFPPQNYNNQYNNTPYYNNGEGGVNEHTEMEMGFGLGNEDFTYMENDENNPNQSSCTTLNSSQQQQQQRKIKDRYEQLSRSRSLMRLNEIERERSKRRQKVVMQKAASGGRSCFPGAIKLSMINVGVLPIKKAERDVMTSQFYEKPVAVIDFEKHCLQRRKYPTLLKLEFNNAVRDNDICHTVRNGLRKVSQHKNQNPRSIPYDYNRVVLDGDDCYDRDGSDYINASYVDSLVQPKAYIVTQGPNEETISDFWRMIWQERCSCIVMVTRTFDFIRVMCVQYWPAGLHRKEVYGDMAVVVENEEQLANFMIRTISLQRIDSKDDPSPRQIILFHYTEWPCHSNPFSNALLEFRRRVRNVMTNHPNVQDGPVVVHCNDGAGRSGVYVAIDANIELSEQDGVFDVFGYMRKMRQQRRGLVETLSQYRFVYETLLEYTRGIDSRFPVSCLSEKIKERGVKDRKTRKNTYQKEYGLITNQTPRFTIGDCAAGHRADNREKNRNVLIVPPDNFRPYLTSFQGNNCTDYINAVFVDGYTHPREYIVTEWPLNATCADIWSLVYDHDCSAVVVLCHPSIGTSNPSFWPENVRSKKYGQIFTVEHLSHDHSPKIRSWMFKINKKIVSLTDLMAGVKAPSKICKFFQLMCWPQGYKVPTSTNSLVELMNMVERWRQKTDYGPVVVISQDGQARAGVYCAANACIEQVIQHGEVDVFQAVKTVRRHRPQLVENITEYKYCYDLVLHYVLHYLNKEEGINTAESAKDKAEKKLIRRKIEEDQDAITPE